MFIKINILYFLIVFYCIVPTQVELYTDTDRHTDKQTDRETDIQTNRHADMHGHVKILTGGHTHCIYNG